MKELYQDGLTVFPNSLIVGFNFRIFFLFISAAILKTAGYDIEMHIISCMVIAFDDDTS